jgi:hypothetical protein
MKMGTKDVLVTTRNMPWGSDCYRYDSLDDMTEQMPSRLLTGARVLKQHRGNGGNGTWKVQSIRPATEISLESSVRVLHAQRESKVEVMPLRAFINRCSKYYDGSGCMIDQPYQVRLPDGMIRCYLVGDRVAGFGHQFVSALMDPTDEMTSVPAPSPRLYYGPEKPEFQRIKALLEDGWLREMQRILSIQTKDLPVLWDADFLYGSKDYAGHDSYVLCEINVSSVSPFPDEALAPLAELVAARLKADD